MLYHAVRSRLLRHQREICRSKPVDDRLHTTGDIRIAEVAFHFFDIAARADKRSEMSTGGITTHAEVIGIQIVLARVGAEKTNGCLAVVGLRRPDGIL